MRVRKCKVAGGGVGNHGDQLLVCVQGNGVKCLVQRDGRFTQISVERQRCLQSALGLKDAQGPRRVKGKPNATLLVRNSFLRVAHAKIDRAARQGKVKGKVALLKTVVVAKTKCRAKCKGLSVGGCQRTVHDSCACAIAQCQRRITYVSVDALDRKIVGVGRERALCKVIVVAALVLGNGRTCIGACIVGGVSRDRGCKGAYQHDQSQQSTCRILACFHVFRSPSVKLSQCAHGAAIISLRHGSIQLW